MRDPRIKQYRVHAERLRTLAAMLYSDQARITLLQTAASWDCMAGAIEQAEDAVHLADALDNLGRLVCSSSS